MHVGLAADISVCPGYVSNYKISSSNSKKEVTSLGSLCGPEDISVELWWNVEPPAPTRTYVAEAPAQVEFCVSRNWVLCWSPPTRAQLKSKRCTREPDRPQHYRPTACCRPPVFFRHVCLIVLSLQKGKLRSSFKKFYQFNFLFWTLLNFKLPSLNLFRWGKCL